MQHLELLKEIIINTTQHATKMPNYLKITHHSRFHEKDTSSYKLTAPKYFCIN